MLSRVADSLYWMGRYLERAENTARLLDIQLHFMLDLASLMEGHEMQVWNAVVNSFGLGDVSSNRFGPADADKVTAFMTFDHENPGSIVCSVNLARENARMIRDQISFEMWTCINALHHYVKEGAALKMGWWELSDFFDQVKARAYQFQGLSGSTYLQSDGFSFLEIGRFVERADQTSRILDIKHFLTLPPGADVGGTIDVAGWLSILRSCSALDAFHSRYLDEVNPWNVADFLILAEPFPRSIRFCLGKIDNHLRILSGSFQGPAANRAGQLASSLRQSVLLSSINDVFEEGLHSFVLRLQGGLAALNQKIFESYFEVPELDMEAEIRLQQEKAADKGRSGADRQQ